MSLSEAPALQSSAAPLRSSSLAADAYVLAIASLPSYYAASASAPSNSIHYFDRSMLRNVHTVTNAHKDGITSLRAVDSVAGASGRVLVTSGKDGVVKVWDDRTRSAAVQMSPAGRPRALLSCDVSPDGLTVAAGTTVQSDEALILYWDPRNPAAPLRTHASTHSDDVTALHFWRPSSSNASPSYKALLSASTDGLVSISNADEDDEDEAVVHVGNWGCSISQAGWIPRRGALPHVWAGSDMETFSTWSEELDPQQDLDIRGPSIHTQQRTWVTDYLIGCHASESSDTLGIFVGSNEGDIALITSADHTSRDSPWTLERLWTGQHTGVVRSILWDERNNVILTGGEDSRLCMWSCPPLPSAGAMETDASPSRKRDHDGDVEMGDTSDTGPKKPRRS
ncbi:WD40 repeat-like protein [Dentipellis sp. KUC8613]|nr:WD40 repeat-like protein [Dentipellis sp. KUC8613]